MGRAVITTEQVRQAGRAGRLEVPAGALVTDAAQELASDLNVTLATPGTSQPASSEDALAAQVRSIVKALLATGGDGPTPVPATRPVKLVHHGDATPEPFAHPGDPSQAVTTVDVVTDADGSPMAAGYMTLTRGSFPWHLDYDEIQIVLEGELHITATGGTRIARAGDIIYVPKGNQITFGTPTWARFVYVTHPANWASQG